MPMTRPVVPFLNYQVTVQPLTALHIGTDDAVMPYEYDIELNDDEQYGVLTVFDVNQVLSHLSSAERREFVAVNDRQDLQKLRDWLLRHADRDRDVRYRVLMAWDAANDLRNAIRDRNRTGEIQCHLRDPRSQDAIVPGSSIKGAVRTAVIDQLLRQNGATGDVGRAARQQSRNGQQFEGAVLGHDRNLRRDPFRQVAFSDAAFDRAALCVERMEAVRRDGQQPQESGIRVYREVLMGPAYYGRDDRGLCQLRLTPQLARSDILKPQWNKKQQRDEDIHLPLALPVLRLIDACNKFYQQMCLEECAAFATGGKTRLTSSSAVRRVMESVDALAENECVIRLGHHSHFDAMTIHGELRQPPSRYRGHIRWFASGIVPLGWAKLTFRPAP